MCNRIRSAVFQYAAPGKPSTDNFRYMDVLVKKIKKDT